MQLSPGEFDSGNAFAHARLDFLTALDKVCPDVRKTLHKRCGSLLAFTGVEHWDILNCLTDPSYGRSTGLWKPEYDTLLERIVAWQEEYHLTDHWIFDIALRTLFDGPGWRTPPYRVVRYEGQGNFAYRFDLARETETEIVKRLLAVFESQLREEILSARGSALEQGAKPTITKRKRPVDELEDEQHELIHFEWLVRHVVNCESYIKIAMRYERTESAVKKAVHRTATQIQLSLSQKKN